MMTATQHRYVADRRTSRRLDEQPFKDKGIICEVHREEGTHFPSNRPYVHVTVRAYDQKDANKIIATNTHTALAYADIRKYLAQKGRY